MGTRHQMVTLLLCGGCSCICIGFPFACWCIHWGEIGPYVSSKHSTHYIIFQNFHKLSTGNGTRNFVLILKVLSNLNIVGMITYLCIKFVEWSCLRFVKPVHLTKLSMTICCTAYRTVLVVSGIWTEHAVADEFLEVTLLWTRKSLTQLKIVSLWIFLMSQHVKFASEKFICWVDCVMK